MARLKLLIAYVGTRFAGWQIQCLPSGSTARSPQPTVQLAVEEAAAAILGHHVRVHGAGRTDSGVHAEGQVAHLDIPDDKAGIDWRRALNAKLPEDVAVLDARIVADDFHSRFDATNKRYTYRLWLSRAFVMPQRRPFVHVTGPLDIAAMDAAAKLMTGTHDFASFQNTGTELATTVRTVHSITRTPALPPHVFPADHNARPDAPLELAWHFEADGFLKQMVRNMMGLLLWVGSGKCTPKQVPAIIAACDRNLSAPTAPACGLTMERVFYDDKVAN
ncbi:tRNA pseudouridine(38-40) synthase TruA [Oleidesulfovibrio sp.]|uniref:tRNA pseudouridine(38-40) synthase TruA n=1 Tax=Oleidesulfovibrio sp. TaxID=2909707 RepID=UPI003A871133